jgi:hypothetical protein
LSPVGDVASAVENALVAYSAITAAPHEYFDHTGSGISGGHPEGLAQGGEEIETSSRVIVGDEEGHYDQFGKQRDNVKRFGLS